MKIFPFFCIIIFLGKANVFDNILSQTAAPYIPIPTNWIYETSYDMNIISIVVSMAASGDLNKAKFSIDLKYKNGSVITPIINLIFSVNESKIVALSYGSCYYYNYSTNITLSNIARLPNIAVFFTYYNGMTSDKKFFIFSAENPLSFDNTQKPYFELYFANSTRKLAKIISSSKTLFINQINVEHFKDNYFKYPNECQRINENYLDIVIVIIKYLINFFS